MKRKLGRNVWIAFVVAATVLALSIPAMAGHYTKQKVVYHINSPDLKHCTHALRNIQNHINAVGADNLDIFVVVHSGGIVMFEKAKSNDQVYSKIKSLKMQGVRFGVCANTMRAKKLTLDDLNMVGKDEIIPSGVAELAEREKNGYSYIKP